MHPTSSIETTPLTEHKDIDAKVWLKTYDYILSNWLAGEEQVALNQSLLHSQLGEVTKIHRTD